MNARNQKLQIILDARKQVSAGALTAEQALTRIVWQMLEPHERAILGRILQYGDLQTADIAAAFGCAYNHASTDLKRLHDYGLLSRREVVTNDGRHFVYSAVDGLDEV